MTDGRTDRQTYMQTNGLTNRAESKRKRRNFEKDNAVRKHLKAGPPLVHSAAHATVQSMARTQHSMRNMGESCDPSSGTKETFQNNILFLKTHSTGPSLGRSFTAASTCLMDKVDAMNEKPGSERAASDFNLEMQIKFPGKVEAFGL